MEWGSMRLPFYAFAVRTNGSDETRNEWCSALRSLKDEWDRSEEVNIKLILIRQAHPFLLIDFINGADNIFVLLQVRDTQSPTHLCPSLRRVPSKCSNWIFSRRRAQSSTDSIQEMHGQQGLWEKSSDATVTIQWRLLFRSLRRRWDKKRRRIVSFCSRLGT